MYVHFYAGIFHKACAGVVWLHSGQEGVLSESTALGCYGIKLSEEQSVLTPVLGGQNSCIV